MMREITYVDGEEVEIYGVDQLVRWGVTADGRNLRRMIEQRKFPRPLFVSGTNACWLKSTFDRWVKRTSARARYFRSHGWPNRTPRNDGPFAEMMKRKTKREAAR